MTKSTLSSKQEIKEVLKSKNKHLSRYVCFYWKKGSSYKNAFTCSKRCLKRAVDRNYFKRLNRAISGQQKLTFKHMHLLIMARPMIAEVPRKKLSQVITNAWKSFLNQSSVHC